MTHAPYRCRVIIAGGRDFDEYDNLVFECDTILDRGNMPDCSFEFISGHARGADKLGERYVRNNFEGDPTVFVPNYSAHGFGAPLIRNKLMAEYAAATEHGILIAFWDGRSRGTRDMIEQALDNKLELHVIRY